jgi:undecaprenyl diphosphate synthase
MTQLDVPAKTLRPGHVAIIMDGNGRWATEKGLARMEGHRRGTEVARDITIFAREIELEYLTLFSFSRQNWRRPVDEVDGLMTLIEKFCLRERQMIMDNDIRLVTIGSLDRVPPATRQAVSALIDESAQNRAMTLTLALDYGGREELVNAVRRVAHEVKTKRLSPDAIDEAVLETRLDTALLPDPDLVIRTSGEKRLSNFLLWQCAYAELYFTEVRWPEFTRTDFCAALWDYARRERRFGATSEQLNGTSIDSEQFELGDLPDEKEARLG